HAGRSTAILSKAMATQMLTEQKDHFGLGPQVNGSGKNFRFGHGGANEGFHSDLRYYPELGVGAAIMTNADGGPALIREIELALAAEYAWPDLATKQVKVTMLDAGMASKLAGSYRLEGLNLTADVRSEDGGKRLTFTAPQLPPAELLPESDTSFVMSTLGWRIAFARDA